MRKGLVFLILLLAASGTHCGAEAMPSEEEEYLYRKVPDIGIETAAGSRLLLSRAYRERPLIITLIYTRCTHICYPYVAALKKRLIELGAPGGEYAVAVLSFDPRDGAGDMQAMARALGLEHDHGWMFGVSSPKDMGRLLRTAGVSVTWDAARKEFDHPALLIGVDREGRIVRRLIGFQEVGMLAAVVRELRGEFVPFYAMPGANVLFRCFTYDPDSGEWRLGWGFLLLALPAGLAFGIVISMWACGAAGRSAGDRALRGARRR